MNSDSLCTRTPGTPSGLDEIQAFWAANRSSACWRSTCARTRTVSPRGPTTVGEGRVQEQPAVGPHVVDGAVGGDDVAALPDLDVPLQIDCQREPGRLGGARPAGHQRPAAGRPGPDDHAVRGERNLVRRLARRRDEQFAAEAEPRGVDAVHQQPRPAGEDRHLLRREHVVVLERPDARRDRACGAAAGSAAAPTPPRPGAPEPSGPDRRAGRRVVVDARAGEEPAEGVVRRPAAGDPGGRRRRPGGPRPGSAAGRRRRGTPACGRRSVRRGRAVPAGGSARCRSSRGSPAGRRLRGRSR